MHPLRITAILTACVGLAGAGACVAIAGPNPTDPFTILLAWVLGSVGASASVLQFFAPKPLTGNQFQKGQAKLAQNLAERHDLTDAKVEATADQVAALNAKLEAFLDAADNSSTPGSLAVDAQVRAGQEQAAAEIIASNDPLDERVQAAVRDGDVDLAITELLTAARKDADTSEQAARSAARRYRDAGLFAYGRNVTQAIQAFRDAAELEPGDVWTHMFLSRLLFMSGDTGGALAEAQTSVDLAGDQRDRSCALNDLGNILRLRGDLPAARKAYEDGLEIAKALGLEIRKALAARDPRNTEWQRDLSISFNKLGDVARQEGDLPAARKAYEDGLEIAKALAALDPRNTEWQRDLSISFNKLGDVARQEGDLPAARKAFEDGLEIRKALAARDPRNTEWQRDLSISYERLGDVARQEGDLPAARKAFEDRLEIAKALAARDPKNTVWQRDLAVSYNKLGVLGLNERRSGDALRAFDESLAITKTLSELNPMSVDWQHDVSENSERLGDAFEMAGDFDQAIRLYEQSLFIIGSLVTLSPSNADFQEDLCITRARLAQLRAKLAAAPPTA